MSAPVEAPGVAVRLLEARSSAAEAVWRALERRAAPAYFLTWGWISAWLACLPDRELPRLAVAFAGEEPVAAAFLGRRRRLRHLLVPTRTRHLNTTGRQRWDALTIEHNAILCAPSSSPSLAAWVEALPRDWDELFLPALSRGSFPGNGLDRPLPGHRLRIDREVPSPYVDLAKVRACPDGYLGLLGTAVRAQVRRAQRGFGPLEVEAAEEIPHALDIFRELVALHTRGWQARGRPGAFADPWFESFHRRLITSRMEQHEIQLLRVRAGGTTVGCLYNLVAGGNVLFYQSGLGRFEDPRLKAGYVCHSEAVRHNAAAGHQVYDLLGGGARYKRSLATDAVPLVWARIQRPLLRFSVEDWLHRGREAGRAWLSRRDPPETPGSGFGRDPKGDVP